MQSAADQTVHSVVMEKLYGRNLWEGFEPTREPGVVHGWNGRHRILQRLPPEASPPILIDVGVWKGQSTISLARTLKDAHIDGCVIAVDTFLGSI